MITISEATKASIAEIADPESARQWHADMAELKDRGYSPAFLDAYFRFTSFACIMMEAWGKRAANHKQATRDAGCQAEQLLTLYEAMKKMRSSLQNYLQSRTIVMLIDEINNTFQCLPSGFNALGIITEAKKLFGYRMQVHHEDKQKELEKQKGKSK